MPVSDIIKFGLGVLGTLLVLHGPFHFREQMRKMEFQILHEASRTDNWYDCRQPFFGPCGDWKPLHSHVHTIGKLSPIRHSGDQERIFRAP